MVIFRWLSLILIVLAVMLLGADLVGTLEKKAVLIRSLHDVLALFGYDAKTTLIANLSPHLLNVAVMIVEAPCWLMLAFLAFSFAVIAPSSKPVRPLPPPPPIPR
jgi:hypothetical protein